MDAIKLGYGSHFFNPFFKYRLNRKIAFLFAVFLGAVPWILFGFDSCIGQPLMLLSRFPSYILGEISLTTWVATWAEHYGKEMHYSAFLIYGLMYWAISRHLDKKMNIHKSKNVAFSLSFLLLSVAVFEFYWIFSFATFQNQSWIITFKFPQARILLQNIGFATMGALGILYFWLDSFVYDPIRRGYDRLYKLRVDPFAFLLIVATVILAYVWIRYPFEVERFSVTLETGETWTNTRYFPQTLYTIDLDPTDSVNAGVWFYMENNLIHALNTIVKTFVCLTFTYVAWVRKT